MPLTVSHPFFIYYSFLASTIQSIIKRTLKSLPKYLQKYGEELYCESVGAVVISCPFNLEESSNIGEEAYKAGICVNTTDLIFNASYSQTLNYIFFKELYSIEFAYHSNIT